MHDKFTHLLSKDSLLCGQETKNRRELHSRVNKELLEIKFLVYCF